MTGRVLALLIAAVLLLGAGVYLFVQIHAAPAPAVPSPGEHRPSVARATPPPAPSETRAAPPPPELPHGDKRVPSDEDRAAVESDTVKTPGTAGIDGKLESIMQQANRAYDRGDLDEAKMIATRVLAAQPTNVRMLRILVSSACIDGDSATATANFAKLPSGDQDQMRTRCARYGMNL